MKSVLPGKPESRLQALATAFWDSRCITAYITGSAFVILRAPDTVLQTVYDDDDQPLEAITIDEAYGKVAVCTDRVVRIYRPIGKEEDALKWALQSSFEIEREKGPTAPATAISLSWGGSEELLVAHATLELYQTSSAPKRSWSKALASPVKIAILSYDSAYIASVGAHDKLVKVWRRLSYGSDDVRFDFTYLIHPQPVTDIKWRRPYHVDQTIDNVLYTFCADSHLRIWTGSDSYGQQLPNLWGKLDLGTSIQRETPEYPPSGQSSARLAFILHGRDFSAATEKAVQAGGVEKKSRNPQDCATLDQFIAVANRSPEICLIFDGRGRMSAWALENLGCKKKKPNIFHIAYVKSNDFVFLQDRQDEYRNHIEGQIYCSPKGHFDILFHSFDGKVEVYKSSLAELFDPKPRDHRLTHECTWSGHSAPIRKIVRNFSGRAIVSRTELGESIVWKHTLGSHQIGLKRQGLISHNEHILRMCVLRKGRFVVFLQRGKISLWDCRQTSPVLLAENQYKLNGKSLCLLILPRHKVQDYMTAHIATISSEKQGVVWEVRLPNYSRADFKGESLANGHAKPSIREFVRFELAEAGDLAYVLPVDPAGSAVSVSGFFDVFSKDVAISYTHSGRVEFWTARVDRDRGRVEWLSTSCMETGVGSPSLASGSTMKKAALVNKSRSTLTIWDIRGARLEYTQDFENHQSIQDIDWTSTPDSQSILAVGFPHRVLLLSQMRFDYLNKGPAWAAVREISIRDVTPHPIGDSTWLGDGHLVIGAGNQLFVHDRQFDVSSSLIESLRLPHRKNGKWDLFEVVQRLNGPLPVFHPQFLSQCLLAGKLNLVHRILLALHKTLKFWVDGESIDDYLGLAMEEFYTSSSPESRLRGNGAGPYLSRQASYGETDETFTEEVASAINEKLMKVALDKLSGHEQIQLVDMVECVGLVEKQRRSLDDNGARFMLFFRQHALRKRRTHESHMSWREINWAYHSTSQDILVDFVSKQHHGALLWEHARESGMFMWLTDSAAVRAQFEIIARNEYTKSEMKNPVDCSLFYLALKKKTILQGLWRMATWNREQNMTQKLLANNFEDPRWRTAALKNAYTLMSKRRFEYAAAFFLLADHLQDAVNVCLSQLKDLQLAIAITRVYEGDNGPVLRKILEEEVLTIAAREGNRWLASWAFWMLRRRDVALRALITPVYNVVDTPGPTDLRSRLFLTDDPALIILYYQLRQQSLQTLRGASKVTPKVEWEFVLHNARLYDRMGCDLLGLDLVRNWEFLKSNVTIRPGLEGEMDTLKLLKRRSSLVVADLPMPPTSPVAAKMPLEMKSGGHQKPTPTVFEEPDANSLLDSFGF